MLTVLNLKFGINCVNRQVSWMTFFYKLHDFITGKTLSKIDKLYETGFYENTFFGWSLTKAKRRRYLVCTMLLICLVTVIFWLYFHISLRTYFQAHVPINILFFTLLIFCMTLFFLGLYNFIIEEMEQQYTNLEHLIFMKEGSNKRFQ